MTIRWRDAGFFVAGFVVTAISWGCWVWISYDKHGRAGDASPTVSARIGNIESDLTAMATGADRYLRSGKRADLAPYARGSAALPKDMAALGLWGDETGTSVKPGVTALLEAAQDESQVVQSIVASAQDGGLTFGPALARGLDEQLPRLRVRLERAKLALEGASI